jgi:DNA-binding NtrC family response regulator
MIEFSEDILLCSQNPLLTKQLYGPLRDSGRRVEISEHAAEAIRCVLGKHYLAVILDSRDVGLNVIEAADIIKSLSPDIYIFIIGEHDSAADGYSVKRPEDLERLVEFINNLSSPKMATRS